MKRLKLTREERAIERAAERGDYRIVNGPAFEAMAAEIARRRKDAVLNIRINSQDLAGLKRKAKRLGMPYQTFVSELLHLYAA